MFRNYKNYDVQSDGRIWSKVSNKFLKPYTRPDGYQQVGLYDNNGKLHFERLHKVVYFAVNGLWEYPDGYELNHIDEDKCNNHISNLQLCTRKQNINWGTHNSRVAKALGKRVGAFKDGDLVMAFPSTMEAGRQGFNHRHVADCCRGERKSHKGFIWKYLDN